MQAPRFWRMKQTLYRLQGEAEASNDTRSIIQRDRIVFTDQGVTTPVEDNQLDLAAMQADVA